MSENRGGSNDRGGSRGRGRGNGRGGQDGNNQRGFSQGGSYRGRPEERGGTRGRGDSQYRGGSRGRGGSLGRNNQSEFFKGGLNQPSQDIMKLEDKIVQGQKNNIPLASLSLKEGGLPGGHNRPGYGTSGTKVSLWANYFDIGKVQNIVLHQYIVKVSPAESSTRNRRRRRIFSLLLSHPTLGGLPLATNYVDKLISPKSLQVDGTLELKYYEAEETVEDSNQTYTISIEPNKEFRLSELIEDLSSTHDTYPDKSEAIQAMNIVLAAVPNTSSNIQPVGQSKHFDLLSTAPNQGLKGGLMAIKGFFHSVRPSTGRLLLNLNVSTAAFYQEGPLPALINEFMRNNNLPNFKTGPNTIQLERFLKGLRVSIGYLQKRGKDVTRVKTIFGIGKNQGVQAEPDKLNFSLDKDGGGKENTNVRDYFKKTYNINASGIVVDVGRPGRSVYIPASLCTVVPGQVTRQKLDSTQTSSMIKIACRKPAENAQQITESGLQLMGIAVSGNGENLLSKFNISPSSQLLAVQGRILPFPKLLYAGSSNPEYAGGWNLREKKFIKPRKNLFGLGCLCLRNDLEPGSPENFMKELTKKMKDHGIVTPKDSGVKYEVPSIDKSLQEIVEAKIQGFKGFSGESGVLIIILPSRDAAAYSFIKYCADVKHGVNTLCICPKPRPRGKPQLPTSDLNYLANLTLKINLKLGGVNHELAKPNEIFNDAIYFGVDVTHPTGIEGVPNAPSIAGVVANTDGTLGQWPASIRIQESRKEMVTSLKDMVIERFKDWKGAQLPAKVLVYRDGVSESQYQAVLREELPQLHEAVATVYGKKTLPKISIVIVGKRHHTRFYPVDGANKSHVDRSSNVLAGTVVDRGVTMERGFDFFMVSHAGIQGTCRPAHYAVIYDDNKLGADKLQNMTYQFCYLFGRATRSVSIVPPAYYADILCERGRCYLYDVYHKQGSNNEPFNPNNSPWASGVHQDLSKTMFYI